MPHPASLTRYPAEEIYIRHGATASFGLHLFVAGLVALIAFLTHIKSIEQLMAEGGSIAQNGPAPEENIEVELRPEDLPPAIPVPPRPKPVIVNKPRFTAPKATGTGESANVSRLVVGSSGFPQPSYPYQAMVRHQTGTVSVNVLFDASGSVSDVEVTESSGVPILDSSTQSFIQANWHNESFAGRHVTVPVEYRMN
jgi:TonB family protein